MRKPSFTSIAFLFLIVLTEPSNAQNECANLAKQGKAAELEASTALSNYEAVTDQNKKEKPIVGSILKAVAVSKKYIESLDGHVSVMKRGEAAGCFGSKVAEWKQVISALESKRIEFAKEYKILLHSALVEGFFVCIVRTKRGALALGATRPAPEEFSNSIRSACLEDERATNAARDSIDNWAPGQAEELKKMFALARSRAISEYRNAVK